jgi:DNA polymerase-3 subunit alpha
MEKKFVHLHVHTEYSVLDGVLLIEEVVEKAKELGMPAVAITDHGNLFGIVEFFKKAQEEGIKPIIGMETYVAQTSMDERNKNEEIFHLTLIAENEEGYENLLRISTESYLRGFYYKPRVDKDFLKAHSRGLIALSGCLQGELSRKILVGFDEKEIERVLESYLEIFGRDNFFLELQDVGFEENKVVNRKLLELSSKFGIGTVATNDVHFLRPEDKILQEVAICIQTGTRLDDPRRMKIETDQIYFKSSQEMWELFGELEEPLINTVKIAERVNLQLELNPTKLHLPNFTIPAKYRDAHEMLEDLAISGLKEKFNGDIPEVYRERLEKELNVIKHLNFSMYFLIIWDLVNEAKKRGIPVGPGRGSAVGSLVLYALQVTEVDPLKYNLVFERFLNPERVSPPDVDIDFADTRRDEMIKYLRDKYGESNVAQIITFGRSKAKQAFKDVARVMGIPYSESDRIVKTVTENATLMEIYQTNPDFRNLIDSNPRYREVFTLASRIEGRVRNISTHAAGVVVAPVDIYKIAPLYKSEDEETVTVQFDMKSLELLGLLKIDLLGLRTLTIIDETVKMVREKIPDFTLKDIPLDDEETYETLSRGDTTGVFQLESEGFRKALIRLKPSRIEDLIAILALYRPGPIKSGMLESYIRRKNGLEPVEYVHESLKTFLNETYGVLAYQEQVMLLASALAGFTLGEADLLRKAMGKKQKEVMEEMKARFVNGCVKNGIEKTRAEEIFNTITPFAEYGFNKSHAAGYAMLAYYTAYLKTHFPLEFIIANLNAEMNTQDAQEKIYKYLQEARSRGYKILPPSVNKSIYKFVKLGEDTILYGLGAIKNVGRAAVEEILGARDAKGLFKGLKDFIKSVDTRKVNKKTLESLIKAGALDEFYLNRKALLASIEDILSMSKNEEKLSVGSLFGGIKSREADEIPLKDLPYTLEDKIYYERESLGFYFSVNPLEKFPSLAFQAQNTSYIKEIMNEGDEVTIVGVILEIIRKKNKNGEPFALVKLLDYHGEISSTIMPQLFKTKADVLKEDQIVLVKGRVVENMEVKEIRVDDLAVFGGNVLLELDLTGVRERDLIEKLRGILDRFRGTELGVRVIYEDRVFHSDIRVKDEKDFFVEITKVLSLERLKAYPL